MAKKFKFGPNNTLDQLLGYYNVSKLGFFQKRNLQKVSSYKLEQLIEKMPYLSEYLTVKTLKNAAVNSKGVVDKVVSNENAVRALSFKQKFAIAESYVAKDATHIFELPNRKLNRLPKETRFSIIENATIAMLKGKDAAINQKNVKSLSEHLVQNAGLFGRGKNFGANLFNGVIDKIGQESKANSIPMLNTFMEATQARLLHTRGKADIVAKAIDAGASLGAIPVKLRTNDIMYRAIMVNPESIQFSPNPVKKTMFEAFVNAASRQVVLGKDKDGKYSNMLSELIENKQLKTPAIKLHKSVSERFMAKVLLKSCKRNPELFLSIKNLEKLGFEPKTILANKILAINSMNVTKQREYLKTAKLSDLLEITAHMKKLPIATRNNFVDEIKAKTSEIMKADSKNLTDAEKNLKDSSTILADKQKFLGTKSVEQATWHAKQDKLIADKNAELETQMNESKLKQAEKVKIENEIVSKQSKRDYAFNSPGIKLQFSTAPETIKYVKLTKETAKKTDEQVAIADKLKDKNLSDAEKVSLEAKATKIKGELKTLRADLKKANQAFLASADGIAYTDEIKKVEPLDAELITIKANKESIENDIAGSDKKLSLICVELQNLGNEKKYKLANEPALTPDEINKQTIVEQAAVETMEKALGQAKNAHSDAIAQKETAEQFVHNMEKGKKATAFMFEGTKNKIKAASEFQP